MQKIKIIKTKNTKFVKLQEAIVKHNIVYVFKIRDHFLININTNI